MEESERANGETSPEPAEGPVEERRDVDGIEELEARLAVRDNRIRELHEEMARFRLAADEAQAVREVAERRAEELEEERVRLAGRVRELEEGDRWRRWRRDNQERELQRLRREVERYEAELARKEDLLERLQRESEISRSEAEEAISRKDQALEDAHRRVVGLEQDLEERETEVTELRVLVADLRTQLEEEYERRRRLAEPANRLRAGIEIFNESEQLRAVNSLSYSLGRPEVHVSLEDGEEPPVVLSFTWRGTTWQTYAADPGLAVEEPQVYLKSAGEDLSGVERQPPNARIGPGGRVFLGL